MGFKEKTKSRTAFINELSKKEKILDEIQKRFEKTQFEMTTIQDKIKTITLKKTSENGEAIF